MNDANLDVYASLHNSFTKYISNGAPMQQKFLLITDAKLGWKLDHKGFALSVILLILQFDELLGKI